MNYKCLNNKLSIVNCQLSILLVLDGCLHEMCIRDRSNTPAILEVVSYKFVQEETDVVERVEYPVVAVSYTHLSGVSLTSRIS